MLKQIYFLLVWASSKRPRTYSIFIRGIKWQATESQDTVIVSVVYARDISQKKDLTSQGFVRMNAKSNYFVYYWECSANPEPRVESKNNPST